MTTPAMQAIQTMLQRKARAWQTFIASQRRLMAIADPRTGGDAGLVHNWGNAESLAILRRSWARWHAYSDRVDVLYRDLCKEHVRQSRLNA